MGNTWKKYRIDYHKYMYGDYVGMFMGSHDDRQLFINIYNRIQCALESLDDEPNTLIKVAVNTQINKEYVLMDHIIAEFAPEGMRYDRTDTGRTELSG